MGIMGSSSKKRRKTLHDGLSAVDERLPVPRLLGYSPRHTEAPEKDAESKSDSDHDSRDHKEDTNVTLPPSKKGDLISVASTVSSILFADVQIGQLVRDSLLKTNDVLQNLIRDDDQNAVTIICKEIEKDNVSMRPRYRELLYRLLLTVFKDCKTDIAEIVIDFLCESPYIAEHKSSNPTPFAQCDGWQMMYLLITNLLSGLASGISNCELKNRIIRYFMAGRIDGQGLPASLRELIQNKAGTNRVEQSLAALYALVSSFKNEHVAPCQVCGCPNSYVYSIACPAHVYGQMCTPTANCCTHSVRHLHLRQHLQHRGSEAADGGTRSVCARPRRFSRAHRQARL